MSTLAVLCTGEELLDGRVLNTNAHVIADALYKEGFNVSSVLTVGDEKETLAHAFSTLIATNDILITTGGLGPTDDDRTVEVLASVMGDSLILDTAAFADIKAYYEKSKRDMPETNIKQAYRPESAVVMSNSYGTAPAFRVAYQGCLIIVLPGVPREMKGLLHDDVIPFLKTQVVTEKNCVKTFKCFGVGESALAELLKPLYPVPDCIQLAFQVPLPEVHIRVSAKSSDLEAFELFCEQVKDCISDACFSETEAGYAKAVLDWCRTQGETLALAESCTGGRMASLLTAEPGASDILLSSVVSYANAAKSHFLGVKDATLEQFGAVSAEVAEEMAVGIRRESGASVGLSVTGIAGPDGGTDEKPVGTVFIALATHEGVSHQKLSVMGDRNRVQTISSYACLWQVIKAS